MAGGGDQAPALPADPQECRIRAEGALRLDQGAPDVATAWALLAVAGELREIRREMTRRR